MAFAVGAEVLVLSLRRKGLIVHASGKGRYRVALGAITSWHDEAELAPVQPSRRKGKHAQAPISFDEAACSVPPSGASGLATLDLHGLTVEEALRAVEARLDEAIRAGLDRIEIIHGISGGKLRAAVHRCLTEVPAVSRFGLDPRNAGVTWVCF